eukprot:358574-Chlamydomonas_euryale.AAC.7
MTNANVASAAVAAATVTSAAAAGTVAAGAAAAGTVPTLGRSCDKTRVGFDTLDMDLPDTLRICNVIKGNRGSTSRGTSRSTGTAVAAAYTRIYTSPCTVAAHASKSSTSKLPRPPCVPAAGPPASPSAPSPARAPVAHALCRSGRTSRCLRSRVRSTSRAAPKAPAGSATPLAGASRPHANAPASASASAAAAAAVATPPGGSSAPASAAEAAHVGVRAAHDEAVCGSDHAALVRARTKQRRQRAAELAKSGVGVARREPCDELAEREHVAHAREQLQQEGRGRERPKGFRWVRSLRRQSTSPMCA